MENHIQVYYAKIPAQYGQDTLYPPARQREIEACAREKVRKEKYYAWKLLERAVQDFLGASITDLRFTKSEKRPRGIFLIPQRVRRRRRTLQRPRGRGYPTRRAVKTNGFPAKSSHGRRICVWVRATKRRRKNGVLDTQMDGKGKCVQAP